MNDSVRQREKHPLEYFGSEKLEARIAHRNVVFVLARFGVARTVVARVDMQVFRASERTIARMAREDFFCVNRSGRRREWSPGLEQQIFDDATFGVRFPRPRRNFNA